MKCLGLLWCDGDIKEKIYEFYDILQDDKQDKIAANDKEFKPTFNQLLDFATEMVFE